MSADEAKSDKVTRVVTRHGDDGYSQVGEGRLPKSAPRLEAFGTVDEANSTIGTLRATLEDDDQVDGWLRSIQMDLFDIGADLSMPGDIGTLRRFKPEPCARLDGQLDELNRQQPPLTNFILPTGKGMAGAYAHLARTVIRRAERRVMALALLDGEDVNPEIQRYLNRLSDFMFVLARHLNGNGAGDEVWAPQAQR